MELQEGNYSQSGSIGIQSYLQLLLYYKYLSIEIDLEEKIKGEKIGRGEKTCGMEKEIRLAYMAYMGLARIHGWLYEVDMLCIPCYSLQ